MYNKFSNTIDIKALSAAYNRISFIDIDKLPEYEDFSVIREAKRFVETTQKYYASDEADVTYNSASENVHFRKMVALGCIEDFAKALKCIEEKGILKASDSLVADNAKKNAKSSVLNLIEALREEAPQL